MGGAWPALFELAARVSHSYKRTCRYYRRRNSSVPGDLRLGGEDVRRWGCGEYGLVGACTRCAGRWLSTYFLHPTPIPGLIMLPLFHFRCGTHLMTPLNMQISPS